MLVTIAATIVDALCRTFSSHKAGLNTALGDEKVRHLLCRRCYIHDLSHRSLCLCISVSLYMLCAYDHVRGVIYTYDICMHHGTSWTHMYDEKFDISCWRRRCFSHDLSPRSASLYLCVAVHVLYEKSYDVAMLVTIAAMTRQEMSMMWLCSWLQQQRLGEICRTFRHPKQS